jgi:hypothetical protein
VTGRDLRTIREACGVTREELAPAMRWTVAELDALEADGPLHPPVALLHCRALARIVRARTPVAADGRST